MCIIYTYIYILWLTLFSKRENCWPKENLIKNWEESRGRSRGSGMNRERWIPLHINML